MPETIYGKPSRGTFKIKIGSLILVSASVKYENEPFDAFSDTVHWFIPHGEGATRLIAVSKTDLGM